MRQLGLLIILTCAASLGIAAPQKYSVNDIPLKLTSGAKAVVREKVVELQVLSTSTATMKVKYAITILNHNALDLSLFNEYYDKFSEIRQLSGTLYDAQGKEVKKYSKSDFKDYSAISDYSLYESSRVKHFDPDYQIYPFTIEYSFEKRFTGLLSFPGWTPYVDYETSVQTSSFVLETSPSVEVRQLSRNFSEGMVNADKQGERKVEWKVTNLPAINYETMSPAATEFLPNVILSPVRFEIDSSSGSMESWNSFGTWIRDLSKGVLVLEPSRKKFFNDLASSGKTVREKVEILYKHLQSNTRYVSVQLGIGGWKPEPASAVDKLGYGDCKALVTYMRAMLECAGIKSYYTIINAGEDKEEIVAGFPSNQFNHAVLCVPAGTDTIWLETTSQRVPAGYMGTFTDDRLALVIFEDTSKLLRTPSLEKNLLKGRSDVTLAGKEAKIKIRQKYHDLFFDQTSGMVNAELQERKRIVENIFSVPHIVLDNFSFSNDNREKIVQLDAEFTVNNYVTLMNDRIIFPVNLTSEFSNPLPSSNSERVRDIQVLRDKVYDDEIVINIPEGYSVDVLPEPVSEKNEFGELRFSIEKSASAIIYKRYLKINKGRFPSSAFKDIHKFYSIAEKADNTKIVAKK